MDWDWSRTGCQDRAPAKPQEMPRRQASRRDEMRENRFAAARNQLHCHGRQHKAGHRGAYWYRREQSKKQHDDAERTLLQDRRQPALSLPKTPSE